MVRCPPQCGSPTPSRAVGAGEKLLPPARGRGEEKEEERLQLRGEVGQKRQTHWGGEDVAPLYLSSRESLLPLVGFGINGGGISAGSR